MPFSGKKRCPIAEITAWDLTKESKNILMKDYDLESYNGFKVKTAFYPFKVDAFAMKNWFKGWWHKDSIEGGIWSGLLPVPLKKEDFENI